MARRENGEEEAMRLETLFSELNGFVIFNPEKLDSFQRQHIGHCDILNPLTQGELGEVVVAEGIAIPIVGVEPDEYGFVVRAARGYLASVAIESTGWIFNSSGCLSVCGIGYLLDFDMDRLQRGKRVLTFKVPEGWLEIDIFAGVDEAGAGVFEIVFNPVPEKPRLNGDVSTNYVF